MISINTVYFLKIPTKNKQEYSNLSKNIVIKIAGQSLKVTPNKLEFEKTENGKPYFKNFPDFNFNISHTNGAIAIAFSKTPIGVDIEKIRSHKTSVADRYFTDIEKAYLHSKRINTDRRFFEIWTKKEAYIKCHGLTIKHLKQTDTSHIHTFQKGEYVISVCSDCNKSKLIVLENIYDI